MITKEQHFYLGLDQLQVAVLDTSPTSPDYLRIDSFPGQLTAGRNSFKLYGNNNKFKDGTPILIELIDASGNTVYTELAEYYDSLKRRVVVIKITEYTAPGTALLTIVGCLRDELVPAAYRNTYNFKWQATINVAPFAPNDTEIIYITPPEVELNTRIKPYISSSYRNELEMITQPYGDYEYLDFTFEDHTGQADESTDIFQKRKANSLVNAFLNPSITAFDRDNVFYLRDENFSAREIVRNYPVLESGKGFYHALSSNLIRNGNFSSSILEYWTTGSTVTYNASTAFPGNTVEFTVAGNSYIRQEINGLNAGKYYLLVISNNRAYAPYGVSLGVNSNNSLGSITINSTATASYSVGAGIVTDAFVLRASDAGNSLLISSITDVNEFGNVRLYEIRSIDNTDFTMNSDMVGGYVQVYTPNISPSIGPNEIQYQTDPATGRPIATPDPSYQSYIDFVLQSKNSATDDRFHYFLLDTNQIQNSEITFLQKHKIDRFTSSPELGQQIVLSNFLDSYRVDTFNTMSPTTYVPLDLVSLSGDDTYLYGVTFDGGANRGGGVIYRYNLHNKQFVTLYTFPGGFNPTSRLLPVVVGGRTYFYGVTARGGTYNSGSLYRFQVPADSSTSIRISTLYNFGQSGSTGTLNPDGGLLPSGDMTLGSDGYIYGSTLTGGSNSSSGPGVIYRFDPNSSIYTKLVNIPGHFSRTGLTESSGSLWGVATFGGTSLSGSIFKYDLSAGTFTVAHSFNGANGKFPDQNLLLAADGFLYGLTRTSSIATEGAVLYKINPSTSTFTDLVHFTASISGSNGHSNLIEDLGYIYGFCEEGGAFGSGSIFRYSTASGDFTVLHTFSGSSVSDGAIPKGNFIRVGNSLYGTTTVGGVNNNGTIFSIDRTGINQPYVSKESGYMYHPNSIIPARIPDTASFGEDYPRWTGPVSLLGGGTFAAVQLQIKNLEPATGDISKIRLGAKQKGARGEYIDLGVYPTTPTDVLIDTNYVNHTPYIDSPYRLTGFFKPVITTNYSALTENPSIKDGLFYRGWATGSFTNSYFTSPDLHNNLSFIGYPALGYSDGSVLRLKMTGSLSGNSMAYAIFTGSEIPPAASNELNTYQQISYELLSSYPINNVYMDNNSYNYYTGSSIADRLGLNGVVAYSAIFTSTNPTSSDDIYAVCPDLPYGGYYYTGSSVSESFLQHPYIFHNKLGYKTDDYLIDSSSRTAKPMYMGMIFEYNSASNAIFRNTVDSNNPNIIDVANVSSREIGDRDYMINKYWEWYTRAPKIGTTLSCSAVVVGDSDVLMDSAKITATNNLYQGTFAENIVVFQTKDEYRFVQGTKYILSFNAVSKLDLIPFIGAEILDTKFFYPLNDVNPPTWIASPAASWQSSSGNWVSYTFNTQVSGTLIPPTGSNPNPSANTYYNASGIWTYGAGSYILNINTGQFTYSSLDNPTSLKVEWPIGTIYTVTDIKPYTSYSLTIPMPSETTNVPKITLQSTYTSATHTASLLEASLRPFQIAYDNSNYTGIEFVNSYSTNNLGGFTTTVLFGAGSLTAGTKLTMVEGGVLYDDFYFPHAIDNAPALTTNVLVTYSIETGRWDNTDPTSFIAVTVNGLTTEIGRIYDPKPNTRYFGQAIIPSLNTLSAHGPRIDLFSTSAGKINEIVGYRITADPVYAFISKANPILPNLSKLTAYGINSSTYGAPFRDQLATNDIGEFIGELEHKLEYNQSGEVKNFGRIEMEFEAEVDGNGKIGFETTVGPTWYLSEISVKPKDRVGSTPNYTNLFIKVPGELVNTPLTFKIEYLNDFDVKAPYVTILNDIILSNIFGQGSDTVGPVDNIIGDTSGGGPVIPPPAAPATSRYEVQSGVASVTVATGNSDSDTIPATFTSVIANIPAVTLVSGNKIKFSTAGTYTITYSLVVTGAGFESPAGNPSAANATGTAVFARYDSTNTLVSSISNKLYSGNTSTFGSTDTLSGTTTVTVNANDYLSLNLTATATVGAGIEASMDVTANSGYVEITA